ncbi:MAG: hypothetical protein ACJ79X_14050 [Gemmatimonadaceae bacterium]
MQTSTQSPDIAPAQASRLPTSITTTGPDGKSYTLPIPLSRGEVRELAARRAALSDQLINVSSRRAELAEEIRTADAVSRTGLEQRLRLLDSRILQLETDLATTGQQLAAAPVQVGTQTPQSGGGDDFEDGVMAGGVGVFAVGSILLFFLRRRWKRRSSPALRDATEPARLERLEMGIEAIAIEVERISEGQRFVTRLLAEAQPALTPRVPPLPASEHKPGS